MSRAETWVLVRATTGLASPDRRFLRNVGTRFLDIRGGKLLEVDGPEAFFETMAATGA